MEDVNYYSGYIKDFGRRYDYPEEAVATFVGLLQKIDASNLKTEFFEPIEKYARGEEIDIHNFLSKENSCNICDRIAKGLDTSKYTADFVFVLCLIPHLEKRYETHGLDKQIFYDSMVDFKCKLWECKRVYNIWGSFVAGWFSGWFYLTRFAFGRIQFELKSGIWMTKLLTAPSGKRAMVWMWQRFVNMHIPSSGPLNHDDVIASYKKAYEFYKNKFRGGKVVFHVGSWLLSPDHPKMLGENSNIVKFRNDFYVFRTADEKDNGDFWRIFNRMYNANKPDFSGETTMQKKYAEMMQCGGHVKEGSGVFIYDGKEFYK